MPDTAPVADPTSVRLAFGALSASDAPGLLGVTPPDTFRWFLSQPEPWSVEGMRAWMERTLVGPRQRAYVIRDASSGAVLGCSSFLDIDAPNRAVEIGATWFAASARGTWVNPECKRAMLACAFGDFFGPGLGCERVTLKCDARNLHSQRAIAKLGAAREGVLRRHRVCADGFVRDSVYYSVLAGEWARVRSGLEARVRDARAATSRSS
jgi:RimJ/RimL family protein N-acetyltransferase